ncbi:MAG: aquaporin [Proteobacteria bacterium]|nr:aquaporin [Pseudomonadota bacterium]
MTTPAVRPPIFARALAELIASAFLLIAVVGSGIAGEQLSGGNTALALLANALATSAALYVIILTLGPVSGAHMNPVVTLAAAMVGGLDWKAAPVYIAAQMAGAVIGVWAAHAMFNLPILQMSSHMRTGSGQWLAEFIATAGLLGVVWGCLRYEMQVAATAVAAYIGGAYWFTASTSFANPAVTVARTLTDTFAGIRLADAPGFMLAQLAALVVLIPGLRWFSRRIAA